MTAPGNGDPRDVLDAIDEAVAGITEAEVEERLRGTLDRAGRGRELHEFRPDWTLRPGALLREELGARGLCDEEFAEQAGLELPVVRGILYETVAIDGPAAIAIGRALGTTAQMWLNAQRLYDEGIARGATDKSDDYREDAVMGEMDAAARAAGYEVEARVLLVHGAEAHLELPGEDVRVKVPAAEVAAGAGVALEEVRDLGLVLVTVRESPEAGRVLSGFRLAE